MHPDHGHGGAQRKLGGDLCRVPEEMEAFRNSNPGIASRIGFTFHFPDYTPEELTQMFGRKMEANGFRVDAGALEQVRRSWNTFLSWRTWKRPVCG